MDDFAESSGTTTQVRRVNRLNALTGKEWIQETSSIWFQKGLGKNHLDVRLERQHPAAFSFQDVMRLVKFFTKPGETVLDPFSGVASTLKACALTGRTGIGIELIRGWAMLGKQRLASEVPDSTGQTTIIGDAREELAKMPSASVDYVVTSPPYWRILAKKPDHKMRRERLDKGLVTKYSDDPRDLGNITNYKDFLGQLSICMQESYRVLRLRKYCSIIVSDFRHNSTYQAFHADVINMLNDAGFALKGITILVQNAKSLYPYGYPYAYVPNIHHQYILNFQKD